VGDPLEGLFEEEDGADSESCLYLFRAHAVLTLRALLLTGHTLKVCSGGGREQREREVEKTRQERVCEWATKGSY